MHNVSCWFPITKSEEWRLSVDRWKSYAKYNLHIHEKEWKAISGTRHSCSNLKTFVILHDHVSIFLHIINIRNTSWFHHINLIPNLWSASTSRLSRHMLSQVRLLTLSNIYETKLQVYCIYSIISHYPGTSASLGENLAKALITYTTIPIKIIC